jgi:signal transduction histidine kinase
MRVLIWYALRILFARVLPLSTMPISYQVPNKNLSNLGGTIWAILAIILVAVWLAVVLGLKSLHQDAISNQLQESNNIARVLQEQTTRVLSIIDKITLRANESTVSTAKSETALNQVDTVRLSNESGLFPEILSQFSIVSPEGRFLGSNLDPTGEKSGRPDLSDREHIRVHLQPELAPDAIKRINASGLFIGKPVLGKVSKLWTIQVSRKLLNKDGKVAGVVVASVNPTYFQGVYSYVKLGPQGNIALIGDDDIVRAQVLGGSAQGIGELFSSAQRDPADSKLAEQTSFIRSNVDNADDVVVSRHIPNYPLRLQVSTSTNWALNNWYETRNITLVLTFLMSLGAIAATVFFVRVVKKIELQSEEIRAQSQQQEMTMDAMQDGVLLIDRRGQLVEVNPMALELLGLRKDNVIGVAIEEVLPGEQANQCMTDWFAFDYPELMVYLSRKILNGNGKVPAIPIPLLSIDATGRLTWATSSACELFGLDPDAPQADIFASETVAELNDMVSNSRQQLEALKHKPFIADISWRAGDLLPLKLPTLLVPNQDLEAPAVFWIIPNFDSLSAYAIRMLHNREWRILRQEEGTIIPVLLTASPLLDPYSRLTGAVLSMKDVRDVKEKEEENLRMVKKMEQSQKLDALGQLAAGVAHDFNNLLGMIQSHAELVEMKVGPDSPAQKNLSAIVQAIGRAHNIVLTLNSLGRDAKNDQKSGEAQSLFELLPLLDETQSLLQASLKGIDINLEVVGDKPDRILLNGESGALQQVLVNLCVNASHAIGEHRKGKLTIETRLIPDGFVGIDVLDNGSGIPPEILPRIFEPFFTTKGVGKGTGLGLAMVHSIITKMQGTIDCQSEIGVGTRFSIKLPCVSQSSDLLLTGQNGTTKPLMDV